MWASEGAAGTAASLTGCWVALSFEKLSEAIFRTTEFRQEVTKAGLASMRSSFSTRSPWQKVTTQVSQ